MLMPEARPICLVTGVGPGTGTAIARRFGKAGYRLALNARNETRLRALADEFEDTIVLPSDLSQGRGCDDVVGGVLRRGVPQVVIHNAVGGTFGDYLQVDPADLERNFAINVRALLLLARELVPAMVEEGGGSLIATGNTSAYRGKPNFAAFAPTKAAQRILLESIARAEGPRGIHCAYVAIDAVIDLPWTRQLAPDKPDDFFAKPDEIAEEVWRISQQPRSAWSFDSIIRPFGETW